MMGGEHTFIGGNGEANKSKDGKEIETHFG